MFQNVISNQPANDSIGAAYTHPLVAGSESNISCKHSAVSSLSLGSLMSSPLAWSSSGGMVNNARCRPKRRASQFDQDQENIDPAAAYDSVSAPNQPVAFGKLVSRCRSPASKKHCTKETDAAAKRKDGNGVDTLAAKYDDDEVQSGSEPSLISSHSYNNNKDVTIKSALNRSDDRLHELIGDFSRPYCLPFIENDKHRDLKAISCDTVNSSSLFCISLQMILLGILCNALKSVHWF